MNLRLHGLVKNPTMDKGVCGGMKTSWTTIGYGRRIVVLVGLVVALLSGSLVAQADEAAPSVLIGATEFEGYVADPNTGWTLALGRGQYNLYGDFETAAAAAWPVKGVAISKTVEIPSDGEYAVWARHFNLMNEERGENYNLNFTVVIVQDGERLFEHTFAKVSKGGWDVWLWDRAPATAQLKKGEAIVLLIAAAGAQGQRGVEGIFLTTDLSYDPNDTDLRP